MQKIPTLYMRDDATHKLVNTVHPDAAWVIGGEGVATRKFDGMTVLIEYGKAFKRITLKSRSTDGLFTGTIPDGWKPAQPEPDPITGEFPGWQAIGEGPEDALFRDAVNGVTYANGTYELIGPKVNGNPEGSETHYLIRHGDDVIENAPRDYEGLEQYFVTHNIEGIVWHHPDGRMAKIKAKDFGIRRVKIGQEVTK